MNGATSYVVYYKNSADATWQRIGEVSNKTTSYTESGLKSGSTGYFTVRAFRTCDGKSYGSTFDKKTAKIK